MGVMAAMDQEHKVYTAAEMRGYRLAARSTGAIPAFKCGHDDTCLGDAIWYAFFTGGANPLFLCQDHLAARLGEDNDISEIRRVVHDTR